MKKLLLLGISIFNFINVFPQAGKFTKPSGFIKTEYRKTDLDESKPKSATAFSGPKKIIKHIGNPNGKIMSSNIFTGSMNVFGYLVSQSRPLQYTKDINAISFIARKNGTYTPTSNGNSGTIVGLWSTNLGASWDETCLWTNGTNLARYPNGGIYNPPGNTNPLNAYLVGSGPLFTTVWVGNWYASKQITSPGNPTPGADQQAHLDLTPTIKKHAMARYAFTTYTVGGIVRSMATVVNDIKSTAAGPTGYGLRGAAMVKGTFNAGAFVWSVDSFIPPVNVNTSGTRLLHDVPIQAWDDQGVNGYVIMLGSRASQTINATHVSATGGYQPIVYKTSTSGASWSLLPANDFANPTMFCAVYNRTYPVSSNSTIICANFRGSEGFDAAVDVNGMLHLGSMIYGHYSNHIDSLDYRYVFGTENYSYGETGPFEYPTYYDFSTKPFGGWNYMIIDSMGTEGPSGTSGQPGYGTNPWTDGSGAKMDLDARFQMSRTSDGKKIFYSWTESDSVIVGLKWNEFPDIKWKGYDVTLNKVTPRYNATNSDASLTQGAYYHYMSNRAIDASSACVTMPFTSTKNSSLDGSINVDTYFLSDQVCPASFSINPWIACTTSINEMNNTFSQFSNFPNPTNNSTTLIIGLKKAVDFEVIVFNSLGEKIVVYKINGQAGSNEFNIDLSSYNSGLYLISVVSDSFTETKKIIKE